MSPPATPIASTGNRYTAWCFSTCPLAILIAGATSEGTFASSRPPRRGGNGDVCWIEAKNFTQGRSNGIRANDNHKADNRRRDDFSGVLSSQLIPGGGNVANTAVKEKNKAAHTGHGDCQANNIYQKLGDILIRPGGVATSNAVQLFSYISSLNVSEGGSYKN